MKIFNNYDKFTPHKMLFRRGYNHDKSPNWNMYQNSFVIEDKFLN